MRTIRRLYYNGEYSPRELIKAAKRRIWMILKKKQMHNDSKIKYGIIRREGHNLGLFSFFITVLGGMHYCYSNNIVPIVDLMTGDNQYKKDINDNAWENFFEQPEGITLSEVENWNEVQIIECERSSTRPRLDMDFFTNDDAIRYWREFVKRHVRLSKETQVYVDRFMAQYILPYEGEKILGVLARGTDYTNLKPAGHPVQPNFNELREKIEEFLNKYNCSKIFLVTEDKKISNQFLECYGDLLILPKAVRYEAIDGKYLAEYKENEENLIENTLVYIASIIGLSQCKYLVAGRTSGTAAAAILGEEYEKAYFFNLGKYGIDDLETLMLGG